MILEPSKREEVIPLPTVLVSTISKEGIRNIAPYACIMPVLRPLDLIAIASWIRRDTLDNIRETKEFVVNVPPANFIKEIMICARNYPKEVDEFVEANLKEKKSKKVKAPSIERCIVWMECVLDREVFEEGKYSIIIGKVVHLEVDDKYFKDGGVDFEKAKPLLVTGTHWAVPVYVGKLGYDEKSIKENLRNP